MAIDQAVSDLNTPTQKPIKIDLQKDLGINNPYLKSIEIERGGYYNDKFNTKVTYQDGTEDNQASQNIDDIKQLMYYLDPQYLQLLRQNQDQTQE